MKNVLLTVAGAGISVLAFPPFGPGVLIFLGVALFLRALLEVESAKQGFWIGGLYGLVFFGGLMWWLGLLDPLALILIPIQAVFFAGYGWWMGRYRDGTPIHWFAAAVGGWAVMELLRYRIPVGGQEWGALGYALSDTRYTALPGSVVGTSGLTVIVVLLAALGVLGLTKRWDRRLRWTVLIPVVTVAASVPSIMFHIDHGSFPVAIVQGSTPCPFEKCPPNERFRTYEQHLELTQTIEPGTVSLVVWPESSTGSSNADVVATEGVRQAIGAEAARLGAPILVGGDQLVGEGQFINANVFFDANGEIAGEYRKQHPVPFGEYIPLRPLFDWIPTLSQVPRDMIRGTGPVLFDVDGIDAGSVISWEGGFSRYALEHRRAGADVLVVATNKASYGKDAPTSDQFIGMTRMRAVELGVPVIHAAVTGKSAILDNQGRSSVISDTGESTIVLADLGPSTNTVYTVIGDALMYLAAIGAVLLWLGQRTLLGSKDSPNKEE